jgi:hypothetical protein
VTDLRTSRAHIISTMTWEASPPQGTQMVAWRVEGGSPSAAEWAATVAGVAAWPAGELVVPVLQRRLWRTTRRGTLRDSVILSIQDPLRINSRSESAREAQELMRPIVSSGFVRPDRRAARAVASRQFGCVIELRTLDHLIPEGSPALPSLFSSLVTGLGSLPGPVAVAVSVAPQSPWESDEENVEVAAPPWMQALGRSEAAPPGWCPNPRRVRFVMRLCADQPIPSALRARAEAICIAERRQPAIWHVEDDETRRDDGRHSVGILEAPATGMDFQRPARPDVAALMLSLLRAPRAGTVTRRSSGRGTPIGKQLADGRGALWSLGWDARRHHVFCAAASGWGKSTHLMRLALADIEAGRSLVVVDPHGDLADELVKAAPSTRLVHIDPRRPDTAPLDLLDADPSRGASHLISAATELWPRAWTGPRWQGAITTAVRVLYSAPPHRPTLSDVERFIRDPNWRAQRMRSADKGILAEAIGEIAAWDPKPTSDDSIASWIAAKLTPLTRGPACSLFERPATQPLEAELDRGAVVVLALPLGLMGAEIAAQAGRMFLTRLTAALAARGTQPKDERQPTSVIIDEAHVVAGPAVAGLYAQARKFHASITLATQSPSQLDSLLFQVLTNAQTLLLGRLPAAEATTLIDRIGPTAVGKLPTLPRFHTMVADEGHDPTASPLILAPIPPPPVPALPNVSSTVQASAEDRRELLAALARGLEARRRQLARARSG